MILQALPSRITNRIAIGSLTAQGGIARTVSLLLVFAKKLRG
jgi:hypothetical protein